METGSVEDWLQKFKMNKSVFLYIYVILFCKIIKIIFNLVVGHTMQLPKHPFLKSVKFPLSTSAEKYGENPYLVVL
jgi:hypothetical protein